MLTRRQISETTNFDSGECFVDEEAVRAYFRAEVQIAMFDADAVTDETILARMAELVIRNHWHMDGHWEEQEEPEESENDSWERL